MIVSASRRTDLPAFYGQWFASRLRAGFCLVPNPFNPRQVSRVSLNPDEVDAFVFWTRDARRFMPVIGDLDAAGHRFVFLFTLTGYGPVLEPHAPRSDDAVRSVRQLAERLGAQRVVWRYDPILLGGDLTPEWHLHHFELLVRQLQGSTEVVKTSLVDLYRKAERRLRGLPGGEGLCVDPATHPQVLPLLTGLRDIAAEAGMTLETCAEPQDLSHLGIANGACIDGDRLSRIFGHEFPTSKDRGQRSPCRCTTSRDIGMVDSCLHGCAYCYATSSHDLALGRHQLHDPDAPSLLPLSEGPPGPP